MQGGSSRVYQER
ncbi:hypothetical protein E2C01_028097 [Portunus trituberculatus]|uniref:Uncharacterized protein n=1 Tax=Portunus trituberculatus TaxID=210409 RepID=A0A5B7EN00_PORTR|nr:hypothetical protein [Portunus trituberculatus]